MHWGGAVPRIVLVTGGRAYRDQATVIRALDHMRERGMECVLQGGASGADRWARIYANVRVMACMTVDAPWDAMRTKAGPIRNGWMMRFGRPDACVHFPGGKGTENMLALCSKAGILTLDGSEIGRPGKGTTVMT